ncbi:MAG: nucleotide exchange factor GrpE [Acidimicrobiaceae bacterium]|nr:nucleotide exchange factor GrpE [Acidimicrobiaceae bacterium]MDE0664898.1 nucleotide exchange factor GrpE [Acidimicrobiaceae bacterium]MXW88231.1 nucleotide exchange factor GrpE [Acidimicrobiaceae bacterium]MXY10045.1 nucleotide exchange factor GrpE [Acidimicrobiaceae bacterium]MXZ64366.1 nucleotide exchange factor GrpE [Acidimicrobiaceae bacterium]
MNASSDVSELEAGSAVGSEIEPADEPGSEPATADPRSEDSAAGAEEATGAVGEPSDLAAVIAERDAYLEDLQRVTAEFTNFRRQTMRRNTELVAQAASRLAKELLVVLDACEAAVSQGVEGIDAVQAQLLGVLTGEGLAVLGTVDEPFDPGFHEAVMSEETGTDGQSAPVVADVLRTGYAWNGRVLRPAMVKVRN